MAIKPILFNTEMVRAILDGRKTQTRRAMKPQAWCDVPRDCAICGEWTLDGKTHQNCPANCVTTPDEPYHPGDILWVRETFDDVAMGHPWYYKADGDLRPKCWKGERWLPSIHMPKEAARIFLCVKDVRAERLHDMTANQAMDEGFVDWNDAVRVWDSTIKKADLPLYGWDANPWVWVIEFERCEKPKGWWE